LYYCKPYGTLIIVRKRNEEEQEMKEKAQELRKELKAHGITGKDVSVRTDHNSIEVKIKNMSIDIRKVEELATKYQSIDRDEMSGETLSGSEFVFVSYDWEILREESKKYFSVAEKVLNTKIKEGSGEKISETNNHQLLFWAKYPSQISVHNATTFGIAYDKWAKFPAYNKEALAQSLAICHHLYGFNY